MPIYEFYCDRCDTVFTFFSRTINTDNRPQCPACREKPLTRYMSAFAFTGKAVDTETGADWSMDEGKMERAMKMLSSQAHAIDEKDPRQTAGLMRNLARETGLPLGESMREALHRMEKGEDPDRIEADMGDRLEKEAPFQTAPSKGHGKRRRASPARDDTLYDL